MSGELVRFIHASDFHLEQPVHGLNSIPDSLRDTVLEAPYLAASRVFDGAILEHVDFVAISGDLYDPASSSPRAIAFLLEQFERLEAQSISVYWSIGAAEGANPWPAAVPLPSNVHLFLPGKVDELIHMRENQAPITLCGVGWNERHRISPSEFRSESMNTCRIAIVYGSYDAHALQKQYVHYWALGGEHQRRTLFSAPHTAHFAGSPQGRSPFEVGPHGCTLVSIDSDGKIRTQLVATDSLRFYQERLTLTEAMTRGDLQRQLRDRSQAIGTEIGDRTALVSWRVEGANRLASSLRQGGMATEILTELRNEFGQRRNAVWAESLEVEAPSEMPAAWYEEDSILGDFLRAVRDREQSSSDALEISQFLSVDQFRGELGASLDVTHPETRQRVLREVALLGVDLLRGND
ncbi:MAG: hypothetical protein FJ295_09755 [Planctomycetes bacterium]|nr:hypothetical protein [Planctomycetota bacterium]